MSWPHPAFLPAMQDDDAIFYPCPYNEWQEDTVGRIELYPHQAHGANRQESTDHQRQQGEEGEAPFPEGQPEKDKNGHNGVYDSLYVGLVQSIHKFVQRHRVANHLRRHTTQFSDKALPRLSLPDVLTGVD